MSALYTALLAVRAALFYLGYGTSILIWTSLCLLIAPYMPYRMRYVFVIKAWTVFIIYWLRICCGVRWRIRGRENIPEQPCVILAKHQSQWETFFLQTLFVPQCTIIKKELLGIPFFGWAFRLCEPIAIDRSDKRRALSSLIRQGTHRLAEGIWVLVFPEGTRVDPGERKEYLKGGAALATETGSPVLPVTHNAGLHWPADRFLKYPGIIDIVIGSPIQTEGRALDEVLDEAHRWIDAETDAIGGNTKPSWWIEKSGKL